MLGSIFMLFSYFVYIAYFTKFTWKLFVYGKTFAREKNQKRKKVLGEKKGKNRSKEERKSTNLLRKEKIALWKRLYWRSSTLASRFPTKFDRHDVKRGFLFFMQVPALLQKRKQAPRIVMNELSVIGSLRLRKEFWDRQRENIVTRYKGTYGERFYWLPKKRFLREIMTFSPQFYYTWIKICWYEGSVGFCWNFHEMCLEKYRKTSLLA